LKILLVHNEYGIFTGEEAVVRDIGRLLEAHGHTVISFSRSSKEIPRLFLGNLRAFCCGIYNPLAGWKVRRLIQKHQPDVAHVHNLFPLISPSALTACKQTGIPVVMTVHNYRLICPNGLFLSHGEICERCTDGREYWCLFRQCEGSFPKNLGYTLRNWAARKGRFFLDNVTVFAALTEFQKKRLVQEGYPATRINVIPNMVTAEVRESSNNRPYVGFAGRISPEKGLQTLMDAARKLPDVLFRAAGHYDRMPELPAQAPLNFKFMGHLSREVLANFYAGCRMIVLPSICFEGFPTVIPEAMLHRIPVICSRIGGLPEIVEDGVTGLLFEPGDAQDLFEKIRHLWDRPDLSRKMGQTGREKALREYSPDRYYERLMVAYNLAISSGRSSAGSSTQWR
jgi:glycosyltransferase involved in cell wall biosynthesis